MKLKTRNIGIVILCLFLFSSRLFAGDINADAGTSSFPFLKINISARAVAMGGAFTGLANDESALYYNPAGIISIEDTKYIVGYHDYFFDMQSGFLGYVKPINIKRTIGFYLSYLNYGSFTRSDSLGNTLGDFGGGDLLFAFSVAQRKNHNLSYGATAKFIYEKIDTYSATGIAFDLAAKYNSDRGHFGAGLMLQNVGLQLSSLGSSKDKLPTTIRTGISYQPKGMPMLISSDLILPIDNDLIFAIGADYLNFKPFYIRLGWNSFGSNFKATSSNASLSGASLGCGFDVKQMQISYSFSPSADLGDSHRITVTGEI
ncbi:MAG TPA: PorV/PorQ family protein [candidate division Zixibacteria bacterium]|nr:PorV/PorQ family protein [candidate division Zixibacteria bacterium]